GGPESGRRVHGRSQRVRAVRPLLRTLIRSVAAGDRCIRSAGAHRNVLAEVERSLSRRRAVDQRGQTLPHHLEGADLRADRRHRRCADDVAPGAPRRRAQLGLPLLRDATFTLLAFMHLGYYEEARAWRDWLIRAVAGSPSQVQIMYGVGGERWLPELIVDWLPGYQKS